MEIKKILSLCSSQELIIAAKHILSLLPEDDFFEVIHYTLYGCPENVTHKLIQQLTKPLNLEDPDGS